jgi:hypothetical protein
MKSLPMSPPNWKKREAATRGRGDSVNRQEEDGGARGEGGVTESRPASGAARGAAMRGHEATGRIVQAGEASATI